MIDRLDELEKKEEQQSDTEGGDEEEGKEDEEEKEDGEEAAVDDMEDDLDEEMDEGTDYINSYFDNGESYLDEEDDNLDDGPIYWCHFPVKEHDHFSLVYLDRHLHTIKSLLQPFWLHKKHIHLVEFCLVKQCRETFMHEKLPFFVIIFRLLTLVHK